LTPHHVCCCQSDDLPHIEAEKFLIIKSKSLEDQKIDEKLLHTVMFSKFTPGDVIDHIDVQGKKRVTINKIPSVEEPLALLKRNKEIFEVIKFMTSYL